MKWPNHGGQPEALKQLFKMDKDQEIMDFSANLNPLGPPKWLKEQLSSNYDLITRYPDPSYPRSSGYLANYEGVRESELLVTNGGAEAIFLVAKYFEGKRALIVQPTFIEYERACQHYHIEVEDVFLEQENGFELPLSLLQEKLTYTDVIFLCRPNNPTGTVIDKKDIQALLEEGLKAGTSIVVDEAFIDFVTSPKEALTSWLSSYPNLILLRSLTKMYTIPGLRIGYVMASEKVITVLKAEQIPWSVNSLADAIVPKLMEDRTFVEDTKKWLMSQTQFLFESLSSLNFYISRSRVNFYLLQDHQNKNRTEALFHYLFQHGILTRHTYNFKGLEGNFLRIAVRSKFENEQLLHVMKKWRDVQW